MNNSMLLAWLIRNGMTTEEATHITSSLSKYEELAEKVIKLKVLATELIETLSDCSPFREGQCMFCGNFDDEEHHENCTYVRLTEEKI